MRNFKKKCLKKYSVCTTHLLLTEQYSDSSAKIFPTDCISAELNLSLPEKIKKKNFSHIHSTKFLIGLTDFQAQLLNITVVHLTPAKYFKNRRRKNILADIISHFRFKLLMSCGSCLTLNTLFKSC